MPIHPTLSLRSVSDAEFAEIDKIVMRCAYATHNKFGRLFDERIYENDLAERLRAEGFTVHTQVPIKVTHSSFEKTYYIDLVVNDMIYEIKVVSVLTGEHESQGLHYAMLQDVRLVKLLNFGEKRVKGRLLPNILTLTARHRPTLRKSGLRILSPNCERLVTHLRALIQDWGTHLSSQLYNEALIHHFGGIEHCMRREELKHGLLSLGTHPVQFHALGIAFIITSLSRDQAAYRHHLGVIMAHANLKGLQWINLNNSRVEITTLEMARE